MAIQYISAASGNMNNVNYENRVTLYMSPTKVAIRSFDIPYDSELNIKASGVRATQDNYYAVSGVLFWA